MVGEHGVSHVTERVRQQKRTGMVGVQGVEELPNVGHFDELLGLYIRNHSLERLLDIGSLAVGNQISYPVAVEQEVVVRIGLLREYPVLHVEHASVEYGYVRRIVEAVSHQRLNLGNVAVFAQFFVHLRNERRRSGEVEVPYVLEEL